MSEQAEGQRLDNTVSRRKIVRLGAIGGIAALTKGILSDAKPASAETPTPAKAPSTTPTATPSANEIRIRTAGLRKEQTVQAEQIKVAEEHKEVAATNTAQAKELEKLLDTRPDTSTPTPTKPPAVTSTPSPTATSTWTADQIRIKREAGLLPPEPTATEHPAERATRTPPKSPQTSGGILGWVLPGGVITAVTAVAAALWKFGVLGRLKKGWKEAGGAATGAGEGTAGGTAAAGTGTIIEGRVISSEDVTPTDTTPPAGGS